MADGHEIWYNNELATYHCTVMDDENDCSIPALDTGRKTRKHSRDSTKSGDISGSATSTKGAVMPKYVTNQIQRDLEITDSEISDDAGDLGVKSVTDVSTNPPDAIAKPSSTKVEGIWRVRIYLGQLSKSISKH